MLIVPDSSVSLYADVPISDGHEILFRSKTEQSTYFATKRIASKAGCTYMRKTGRIRIEWSTSEVLRANFISFKNPSFENITFYAKLIDYEYVNNVTTDVLYEIDWFQSFCFDVDYHACSILREHLTEVDYQKAVANPWRRDIPELLTDEGLPCDKTLEKIYNRTNYFNDFTGEMTSLVEGSYTLYTIMLLSEFDFSEWPEETKTEFLSQIEYFGGNIDVDNPRKPTNIEDLFGGFDNNFPNAIALIGFNMYNTTAVDKVLDILTVNGVSSSVVGIYVVPDYMLAGLFDTTYKGNAINTFSIKPTIDVTHDPKLNTFPFKYARVMTPQDTKEYRLDLFKDLSDGNGVFKLKLVGSVNGLPRLTLYPVDYIYNTGEGGNFYERLNFENFPQVSYSIDAYLTFLSGQYNQAIMSNTMAGQASKTADLASATAGQYKSLLPTSLGMMATGMAQGNQMAASSKMGKALWGEAATAIESTMLSPAMQAQANYEAARQNVNIQNEAMGARTGSSAVFNGTKRAFINDQYVAGGSGVYGMYAVNGVVFDLQIVSLADDIIEKYSDYLSIYGYKSLRTGRPHVCDYVTDGSNAPHFSTFDDETFTYVQTEDMHVTGALQVACKSIENLFNAGCRFLKVVE